MARIVELSALVADLRDPNVAAGTGAVVMRNQAADAIEYLVAEVRAFRECICPVEWDRSCPTHIPPIG